MENTEALEIGRILVDIPLPYIAVKELYITDNANEYGTLYLCLTIPDMEEKPDERLEGQPLAVFTPQGEEIFAGLCTNASLGCKNGYVEMSLEAKGHAYVTDQTPKNRTFQSSEKTMGQIADMVLEEYSVSLQVERDIPIEQMLSQQEETDWQFLKRIANQFGMMLFTDIKSSQIRIHIGTVAFSDCELILENEYAVKDIAAYWDVKQNVRKDASAYEFLQTGGSTSDLTVGSGCVTQGKGAPQIVTKSEIISEGGMLRNEILLTYVDGVIPTSMTASGQSHAAGSIGRTEATSFTSVLTGEVTGVYGTDIEVEFDEGQGGVRRIPYTTSLGNDIYVMPDKGDKVFCYYDNSGEIVALGSKFENTSYPDFNKPNEKSFTANNRMIKFLEDGIDLIANRDEYDGKGGNQVKIIFSDTDGIDISSAGDINITADLNLLLQAKDLSVEEEVQTEWFDDSFAANMEKFSGRVEKGHTLYEEHKGTVPSPEFWEELRSMAWESTKKGAIETLKSPVDFLFNFYDQIKQETQKDPEKLRFHDVKDKRISLIAMQGLKLSVGDSCILIGKSYVILSANYFEQLGLVPKEGYIEISESQRTGMDVFLDFVNLVIDVACMIAPVLYPLKLISASIYVFRGDYTSAVISLIPSGAVTKMIGKAVKGSSKATKILNEANKVMAGLEMANAMGNLSLAEYRLRKLFNEEGFGMINDLETWENVLLGFQSAGSIYGVARDMDEASRNTQNSNMPVGDNGKIQGDGQSGGSEGSTGQGTEASKTKKSNEQSAIDPVDVVTGSQKIAQAELVIKDVSGDFVIRRYYESIYKNGHSLLGERWFLNVGSYLYIQGSNATILLPNRHLERFARNEDGLWENLRGKDGSVTLKDKNRGYELYQKIEEKTYRYDSDGKLTGIVDRNGNVIILKYVGAVLVEMDFPSGQVISFHYENNKLTYLEDIIGRRVRYRYKGELLTEVTYPNGGTIIYSYTAEGYLESITDQNGNRYVRNEYAQDGRVTRQFLGENTEMVILYDDNNRINTFLNLENNDRVEYHYNKDKLIVKTVYADGSNEEIRYDERENKIWEKDRRGNERTRLFNEDSCLVEQCMPNHLITHYEYDENGRLSGLWDNAGSRRWFRYDRHGNPVEICQEIADGVVQKVQFTYDSLGRTLEVLDANGNVTKYSYEGKCPLPSSLTTPENDTYQYRYDKAGRCMEVSSAQGTTRYAYNHMNYPTMVTNPLGETTKYYYDGLCNLTRVVKPNQTGKDGSNIGIQYIYDSLDAVVKMVDALGNVWATPRDVAGNILKEIHPETYNPSTGDGEGISYEYDVFDHRTRICYPDGGVERIKYDASGNIIKKISPMQYDEGRDDGAGWCYEYDEMNRLIQITDPEGVVQQRYVYDLQGNVVKRITAKGYLAGDNDEEQIGELYRYNYMGWVTEARKPMKEENGEILYQLIQYRHDQAGNLVKELRYRDYQTIDSEKGVIHTIDYEYDRNNRLIRVSDCTGAVMEYQYDCENRRTLEKRRISDTVEQKLVYVYDGAGRLIETKESADEDGCGRKISVTRYEYDHNGNLTRILLPYGAEIRREYDVADRLTAEIHLEKKTGLHNTTRFTYDKAGNLICITDNLGRETRMEYSLLRQETCRMEKDGGMTRTFYDLDQRRVKVLRPKECQEGIGIGEQYSYDLQGRLLTVTRSDGVVQENHTYDVGGLLIRSIDSIGNSIHYKYDLGDRRIYACTDSGSGQQYEYDASGSITGIVDGEGNRTEYVLDEWGRIVEVKRADGVGEFYRYDYAGNVILSVDGNGNTTQYEYNCAGKLSRMTDPTGAQEQYYYDIGNRLCQKTDRNGIITNYAYNLYGNLTGRKARNPSQPDRKLSETYEYTPEGLLKSAISGGMRYGYEYDGMNRLVRKSASGRTLLSYAYDLNGNLTHQKDVTGKITEYRYNSIDLLENVTDNGNMVVEYLYHPDGTIKGLFKGALYAEYKYDADRNLTGLKTTLDRELLVDNHYHFDKNGNQIVKQQIGGTTRYTYDVLNQLTKVEYPSYTEELYYDKAGNRSRRVIGGTEELYRYDPRNRLTEYTKGGMSNTFTYDNAGNLLTDDRARYTYDVFNRTEKVETFDGHIQINRYDAEGLRQELEEDGKLVQFI
ncbi:MAG: hypothetical protein J1E64_07210, partial [Acetatifactor sp.]|nr:hypothetical protein [Acetatifactor sp.]